MKKQVCYLCNYNCQNCFHSDFCGDYQDKPELGIPEISVSTAFMELCHCRHSIPEAVDGSIFDTEVDPTDVYGLEEHAMNVLKSLQIEHLNLYVTGLTVALVAVLNAARKLGVAVMLYHYDRTSGSYYSQEVWQY